MLGAAVRWRVGVRWYLVVLAGLQLSWAGASLLGVAFGEGASRFASMDGLLPLPVLLFTDPGPIGEEIGGRGFALPGLLERASALLASVALSLVWAVSGVRDAIPECYQLRPPRAIGGNVGLAPGRRAA